MVMYFEVRVFIIGKIYNWFNIFHDFTISPSQMSKVKKKNNNNNAQTDWQDTTNCIKISDCVYYSVVEELQNQFNPPTIKWKIVISQKPKKPLKFCIKLCKSILDTVPLWMQKSAAKPNPKLCLVHFKWNQITCKLPFLFKTSSTLSVYPLNRIFFSQCNRKIVLIIYSLLSNARFIVTKEPANLRFISHNTSSPI